MPASAQAPGGEVFQGEAKGVALELRLLGQGTTLGLGSAKVTSEPTAVGEGTGVAAIASTVSRSSGNQNSPQGCAVPLSVVSALSGGLACGDSSASIAGGNPTAEGTGTVAAAGVDLASLTSVVTPLLTTLTPTVCGSVPPIQLPGLPPLVPPVAADCTTLINGVTASLRQPVTLTVGDSAGRVVTDANRVTATGTAAGATVSLLNRVDVPGQACAGPLAKITVGDSKATAVYNRGSTESTSSVDPALATVDLCLITSDPAPIKLAVGQSFTVPGTDITVTAASGRTFRGSAGAEANAASITGLGGQLVLRVAGASAIVDGGRPQVQGVEVTAPVGDLPRTGSGLPPWTPVAGLGMLVLAVLAGRMVLKAR
jgi:hypothetical protein